MRVILTRSVIRSLTQCLTLASRTTKDNMVMVAGEIAKQAKPDYDKVFCGIVAQIGFDKLCR